MKEFIIPKRLEPSVRAMINKTNPGELNMGKALRIKLPIDSNKFEQCVNKVVNDFDAYRMSFVEKNGQVYAVVQDEISFVLPIVTVPGKNKEEKMQYLYEEAGKKIYEDFDASDRCWRVILYKLGVADYVVLIALSHAITDGISLAITFYNIFSYYFKDKPMFSSSGTFCEYLEDEKAFLSSDEAASGRIYWEKSLQGYAMPEVRPIGELSYESSKSGIYMDIPRNSLSAILKTYNTNAFVFFLAIMHLSISCVNGHYDSVIKCADANRNDKYKCTAGLLAIYFLNRIKLERGMRFSELLTEITNSIKRDYPYNKTAGFYTNKTNFAISYIPNNKTYEVSRPKMKVLTSLLDVLKLSNGRDSCLFVAVINEMPDKYIMELSGSSRIYGQGYIDKFCETFSILIDMLSDGVDRYIGDMIEFEDIVEEI